MATEAQRARVWEEWLGAEIRANYFGDLAGSYFFRQRVATWLTLFFSSGAVVTWLAKLPQGYEWLVALLASLAAGASVYSVVTQNVKAAVESADLHYRWNKLATEYRDIWDDLDNADVQGLLAKLSEREAEVSKSGTAIPYSEKRMLKWFDMVVRARAGHALAQ